jgi:hypothetical protein
VADTAFSRALRRMSLPELRALWAAEVDGRLDATLRPKERFACWYRRQMNAVFMERFSRLSAKEASDACLRLAAGEDVDEILPASTDAGHPLEGHDDHTHPT